MKKLVCLIVLLSGCASPHPIKQTWLPNDAFWREAEYKGFWLRRQDGTNYKFIKPAVIRNLLAAKDKIEGVSFIRADLGVVETAQPNAFAVVHNGKNLVAFSISYLDLLGEDVDAIATTMGHEIAHLKLEHGKQRAGRQGAKDASGFALGFVLGAVGIPFGGALANVGTDAVFNSFTREEERDADNYGLKWTVEAGFDPCGQVRVSERLQRFVSEGVSFLSTHPGFQERSALADEYSRKSKGVGCS